VRPWRCRAGAREAAAPRGSGSRAWAWSTLALILAVGLGLRLWGVKQGLPYIYNIDEDGHFVPKAVKMFSAGLNPHYFINPPALTYVLHLVFAVWYGGRQGVESAFARHPDQLYLLARVTVALLGAGAVWMLYLAGARMFDRRVALLAAALEAVAFLPVSYGHYALNDVPTLLPLTLSLFGSAGVLRRGRKRDYVLAGIGLGLGCASKYTAGIVIVPLLAAIALRYLSDPPAQARRVLFGTTLAGACALLAFLLANPYALLDFSSFHAELVHQSSLSDEAQGKLGAPRESGFVYYLWSFSWGLGWVPAFAALAGAFAIWRRDRPTDLRSVGWMLVPAPILFLVFMGLQDRYFGRWLLPIFPVACLLAAFFALDFAERLLRLVRGGGYRAIRPAGPEGDTPGGADALPAVAALSRSQTILSGLVVTVIVVLMLAQGAIYSVHNDLVLSRADTRNLTREWMVAHVPSGARIVLEPVVLNAWIKDGEGSATPDRWVKYPALQSVIAANGTLAPQNLHAVALENYETTLAPALIGWYERLGYCWVVSGYTESGRALVEPSAAPLAVAYYRALAAQGHVVYRISPYAPGSKPVDFNFDWTFDYYPLAYSRPGPEMTVYRLDGGLCARSR
jgi:hypothetical protein